VRARVQTSLETAVVDHILEDRILGQDWGKKLRWNRGGRFLRWITPGDAPPRVAPCWTMWTSSCACIY
jgi:hypothetical protein